MAISTQVLKCIPTEISQDEAADGAHDIHRRTDTLERDPGKQVQQEQEKQQAGDADGAPAQPLFHGQSFHRHHTTRPAAGRPLPDLSGIVLNNPGVIV